MLSVQNLTRSYENKETPAVKGVSFFLEQNKILGIFGKSGSGKTTLLKLIAGLLQPEEGNIHLQEERIQGPEEKLVPGHEEIQVVFQDFKLKHRMTVRENIDYMLLSYEYDYRQNRLETVIELCMLQDVEHKKVEELSGGQQQRVAIARAIANEPKLLLMDEPFSNLDLMARSVLKQVVRKIANSGGTSVLYVSHDPAEVLSLSDQIIILQNGICTQHGTPKEIYDTPADISIAEMFSKLNVITKGKLKGTYRPEAFTISTEQSTDLEGQVTVAEYFGSHQLLQVMLTTGDLIIVPDPDLRLIPGDQICIRVKEKPLFTT